MKIVDNCLSKNTHLSLKNTMLNSDFPWYYYNSKVSSDSEDSLYNFQFIHNFYNEFSPKSNFINLIEPILEILNPSAIVRIKANLTTVCDKILDYDYHTDFKNFKGKTAIYYVNSNNGVTKFQTGEIVESVENRLIIFDSNIQHCGTTSTSDKTRCLINFNYYEWNET